VTGDPDLSVTWTSDDAGVATVDGTGRVTGRSVGTTWIRARSNFDPSISGGARITVEAAADGIDPVLIAAVDEDGANLAPAVVRFDASASYDPDGTVVAYAWVLDGQPMPIGGAIADVYLAEPGLHTMELTLTDDSGRTTTDTVTTFVIDSGAPFTIDVVFFDDADMTLSQRRSFSAAARRWAEVIQSDLPALDVVGASCSVSPSYTGTIDDLLIFASIGDIDGPAATLARAGPCFDPAAPFPPRLGIMEFDREDLDILEGNSDLEGVVLHEMGHVLGIGTLWNVTDDPIVDLEPAVQPVPCYGEPDPRYIRLNAAAEWQALSGQTTVPVEEGEPDGTSCGHWNEWDVDFPGDPAIEERADLYAELMTGYLDASMSLSRVTVGALEDLGYAVDYAAADPFTLLSIQDRERRDGARVRLTEELVLEPVRFDSVR
jgi:hypothetical protein